jgi:hypothetical protein
VDNNEFASLTPNFLKNQKTPQRPTSQNFYRKKVINENDSFFKQVLTENLNSPTTKNFIA